MFEQEDYQEFKKKLNQHQRITLLAREGTGKSRFIEHLIRHGHNVVFLTRTNDQARWKYLDFKNLGLDPQLIESRERKLELLGVEARKTESKTFHVPLVLREPTIESIKNTLGVSHDRAVEIYDDTEADKVDLSATVICGTFALARHFADVKFNNPWVVVFDDPEYMDVIDSVLVGTGNKLAVSKIHGGTKGLKKIDFSSEDSVNENEKYIVPRPEKMQLTYGIKTKCVITTTDDLIADMAHDHLKFTTVDKTRHVFTDNVFVHGTTATRRTTDWLIPIYVSHVKQKLGLDISVIGDAIRYDMEADGQDQIVYTHIKSHGVDFLKNRDLIVEISAPHEDVVASIWYDRGISKWEAKLRLMINQAHQAIGRNSGHRFSGRECHLFIDSHEARSISDRLQYQHTFYMNGRERGKAIADIDSSLMQEFHDFLREPIEFLFKRKGMTLKIWDHIKGMNLTTNGHRQLLRFICRYKRLEKLSDADMKETRLKWLAEKTMAAIELDSFDQAIEEEAEFDYQHEVLCLT